EPRRLFRVGHVGLDGPAADLGGDLLGFLGTGAVADDDLRSCPRELHCDRAPDPARAAGDEREPPVERAELAHAPVAASSIFSSVARLLTEIALTLRSMRLTRPERTLPGPTSTNVRVPSLISSEAACVNRTGAVSWSTSSGPMRWADS